MLSLHIKLIYQDQFFYEKKGLFFTETKESLEHREKWQRKLYSAIFHKHGGDSLLSQVFKKEAERTEENREYVTIPYLFKACEKDGFKLEKIPKSSDGKLLPVFIFGLSGMVLIGAGPIRMALGDLSRTRMERRENSILPE